MLPWLVHLLNTAWLATVLIGVPVITARSFAGYDIGSPGYRQMLTLWGAGLGAGINLGAWLYLKNRKTSTACRNWAMAFGGVLALEYLVFHRQVTFDWLAKGLLWLKGKWGG